MLCFGIGLLREFLRTLLLSLHSLGRTCRAQGQQRLDFQVLQPFYIGAQTACSLRLLYGFFKITFGIGFVGLIGMLPGSASQRGLCSHGVASRYGQHTCSHQRMESAQTLAHACTSTCCAVSQAFCCCSKALLSCSAAIKPLRTR